MPSLWTESDHDLNWPKTAIRPFSREGPFWAVCGHPSFWAGSHSIALRVKVGFLRERSVANTIIHICKSCWHMKWMTVRTSTIFALLLGFGLAVTSVVSATHMAPNRTGNAQAVYAMVFGLEAEDFCGSDAGHGGHAHNCPFCHALPNAPQDLCLAFRPHEQWRQIEPLRRAASARNINHSTRAPPRIA